MEAKGSTPVKVFMGKAKVLLKVDKSSGEQIGPELCTMMQTATSFMRPALSTGLWGMKEKLVVRSISK